MPHRRVLQHITSLARAIGHMSAARLSRWRPHLSPAARELTGVVEDTAIAKLGAPDARRRWEAAATLGRNSQRSPEAVAALIGAMEDPEPFVRWQAAEALGKQEAGRVFGRLSQALAGPSPLQRAGAAQALGRLSGEAACQALVTALDDKDAAVRTAGAHALGSCGDPTLMQALVPLLEDPDLAARCAAAQALGRIGDTRAAGPLAAALRPDQHLLFRRAVAAALARVPHPEVQETLLAALRDPDPQVRGYSAQALGQVGNEGAWLALQPLLADTSPLLRSTVAIEARRAVTLLERRGRQAQSQLAATRADEETER
jgi:HEAT repeat protein